jgi:hypothetical protein
VVCVSWPRRVSRAHELNTFWKKGGAIFRVAGKSPVKIRVREKVHHDGTTVITRMGAIFNRMRNIFIWVGKDTKAVSSPTPIARGKGHRDGNWPSFYCNAVSIPLCYGLWNAGSGLRAN